MRRTAGAMMAPHHNPPPSAFEVILEWWTWLCSSPALAGGLGGFVRWLIVGERGLVRGIVSVTVGCVVAHYSAPTLAVVADHYAGLNEVPDLSLLGTLAFLLGLVAKELCDSIMQRVGRWLDAPPSLPQ